MKRNCRSGRNDRSLTESSQVTEWFILPVGIALGMGLLSKIIGEIRKAF